MSAPHFNPYACPPITLAEAERIAQLRLDAGMDVDLTLEDYAIFIWLRSRGHSGADERANFRAHTRDGAFAGYLSAMQRAWPEEAERTSDTAWRVPEELRTARYRSFEDVPAIDRDEARLDARDRARDINAVLRGGAL